MDASDLEAAITQWLASLPTTSLVTHSSLYRANKLKKKSKRNWHELPARYRQKWVPIHVLGNKDRLLILITSLMKGRLVNTNFLIAS